MLRQRLGPSDFLTSLIKARLLLSPLTFQKARCLHCAKCHNLMPPDALPHAWISLKIDVGWKLVKKLNQKCTFDFRKCFFFSYITVHSWISLPSEIVQAESLNTFKARLDKLGSLTGCLHAVAVLSTRPMKRVKFTLWLHHANSPALHNELW